MLAISFGAPQTLTPAGSGHAQEAEPFLRASPVVVVSDRPVCSLLGEEKLAVGILGQDSGGTVEVGGVVYWTFGDTRLADGWLPNTISSTTDGDAADCIDLVPKTQDGRAAPLLTEAEGEVSVWPLAMEAVSQREVYVYYASVVPGTDRPGQVAGIGLASFDPATLTAKRLLGGKLVWSNEQPMPSRTLADGDYIYLFLSVSREYWTMDTILARVRSEAVESPASYEYWQPGTDGKSGQWLSGLWNEELGAWDPKMATLDPLWRQSGMHNGVEVAYNSFLKRWVAVYTSRLLTSVNARTAPELTGPWDDSQSTLVDCPAFHPAPKDGFVCYSGAQHEYYARDGGRTIYVTYSNSDAYQTFLHEIHLAASVTQWSDDQGRAIYLPGDAQGPAGFRRDGIAFYASDIPVPGLVPIHRWQHLEMGDIWYGASPPGPPEAYRDLGVDFFAALDAAAAQGTNALYAPVFRWTKDERQRYSPLDLASAGYVRQELAFYAPCPDADGDGLTDCLESFVGANPSASDTDGDGLGDGYERSTPGCDPLLYNDDRDGLGAELEVFFGRTNPCVWDTGAWGCQNAEWRHPDCDIDTDGDRCRDAWEQGPDPNLGGLRDPDNPWDYFNPTGDGENRTDDVAAVVGRYFAREGDQRYSADFDRGGVVGPYAWNLGPPDGLVSIQDIRASVKQYGHDCPG